MIRSFTQFEDMRGTSCADDNDNYSLNDFLIRKDLITKREYCVGVEFYSGEVHGITQEENINVDFHVVNSDWKGEKSEIKVISHEMDLREFFGCFKRFSITLSQYSRSDEGGLNGSLEKDPIN